MSKYPPSQISRKFLGRGCAVTGFIPVSENERSLGDAFNLSLVLDKFGKGLVKIMTRVKVGAIELGKHQFLLDVSCQTQIGAIATTALINACIDKC